MIEISKNSKKYPQFVRDLQNYPSSLFFSKEPDICYEKNIVFIGSRNMSPYGRDVCKEIVPRICNLGFNVVSGMADGIDSYCHRLAMKSGSQTIGILGYGFNYLNSRSYKNSVTKKLSQEIAENGKSFIVSPFSNNTFPSRETFLERNKILAAFAPITVVIEAASRSGTFSTVNAAIMLNKKVFAVPGSIFSYNSIGCHELIKEGCLVLTSVDDILVNLSNL